MDDTTTPAPTTELVRMPVWDWPVRVVHWAMVLCLVSLVIYGFVCRAAGLPTNAGMISLATFFFLTEVIEPPFLSI